MEATHASFFSGVGGLDLGLERAGWRTVSFSEIDPYASAVLAERWPGVPNLGDIVELHGHDQRGKSDSRHHAEPDGGEDQSRVGVDWRGATLWTGGFPCQDLSVAGKRRGLAGSRSGLAFSFLELVGRHRPRFVLLENVPGLLSSHAGRDFGTLLDALVQLGYGVGYRVLDARYFGVPQRRRRVFILGDSTGGRAGAERAAEVLSVGSRCHRHPPTGVEAGPGVAERAPSRSEYVGSRDTSLGHHGGAWGDQAVAAGHIVGTLREHVRPGSNSDFSIVERPSSYSDRVRETDGLARRPHDREVVNALDQRRGGADDNEAQAGHLVAFNPYRTLERDGSVSSGYAARDVVDALHGPTGNKEPLFLGGAAADDPLLPLGLDSHRYRCCGNGVVSDVAEWIGRRLLEAVA